ncbi:hypothetical protein V6N11_052393 [Hibiscus sabdariffa]|uniref:Uncharacterized protein n=1 Tax=Hibiscus sabdariffa TaxID=183260 RepID=A0ABR2UAB2_9ROSI
MSIILVSHSYTGLGINSLLNLISLGSACSDKSTRSLISIRNPLAEPIVHNSGMPYLTIGRLFEQILRGPLVMDPWPACLMMFGCFLLALYGSTSQSNITHLYKLSLACNSHGCMDSFSSRSNSDCQQDVRLVNDSHASSSPISLVQIISMIHNKRWTTEVKWIPLEENHLVDEHA